MLKTLFLMLPVFLISTIANAQMISVNFHVGNDADAQDSHVFDGTETAGLPDFNTAEWNNVDVGNGGVNAAATEIFAPVLLSDDSGNQTTTLSSTLVGADVQILHGLSVMRLLQLRIKVNCPMASVMTICSTLTLL